jgi:hypothetical protein
VTKLGENFMSRVLGVCLLAIALLLVAATPSLAWHHGRVFIDVGPFWWGPYPPPYPYYVYPPPPVIVTQPPVYIQQQPSPAPPPQGYWYYCPSARAYYPTVPTCPEAWVKVPPRPE